MDWLNAQVQEFSVLWLLLSGVIGGFVGGATKFLFDDFLSPKIGSRREAREAMRSVTVPLCRASEQLERQINNFVRNDGATGYSSSQYYRLSTLYSFGEYLAWSRVAEQGLGHVDLEKLRSGRRLFKGLNGFYRALTSFTYFSWSQSRVEIADSSIHRRIFTAIGEQMRSEDEEFQVMTFSKFCIRYENDVQFRAWFRDLDGFLRTCSPDLDAFKWDRLIAAEANLYAFSRELNTSQKSSADRIHNLSRLQYAQVRAKLEKEFPKLATSKKPHQVGS